MKKKFIAAAVLAAVFVLFIILVKTVGVAAFIISVIIRKPHTVACFMGKSRGEIPVIGRGVYLAVACYHVTYLHTVIDVFIVGKLNRSRPPCVVACLSRNDKDKGVYVAVIVSVIIAEIYLTVKSLACLGQKGFLSLDLIIVVDGIPCAVVISLAAEIKSAL